MMKHFCSLRYMLVVVGAVMALSLLSTYVTGWPWLCWHHDYLLSRYERSLRSIVLPDGCRLLETQRAFVPPRSSNHLDALVLSLVECEVGILPPRDAVLDAPFDSGILLSPLRVIARNPFQISSPPSFAEFSLEPFEEYMQKLLASADVDLESGKVYYILLAMDQAPFTGFHMWDYRGN